MNPEDTPILWIYSTKVANNLENEFGDLATTPEAHPSKWVGGQFLFPVIRIGHGAFAGPYRSRNDMHRFQAMERNAAENETFFFIIALIWPYAGLPDWAPTALSIYVYSRFLHFILYCFVRVQPWRAVAWVVGVVVNLAIAVNILIGLDRKGGETDL
jgi:uncharacterized MAPEG superfamily protein